MLNPRCTRRRLLSLDRTTVRSIIVKILMWCLGTLAFSWVGLVVVSRVGSRNLPHTSRAETGNDVLESAIRAYEAGGADALSGKLVASRRTLSGKYSLLDAQGHDLVTHEDRATMIAAMQPGQSRVTPGGGIVIYAAANGRYSLVWMSEWVNTPNALIIRTLLLYYLPVLAAVAALFWLLAWNMGT